MKKIIRSFFAVCLLAMALSLLPGLASATSITGTSTGTLDLGAGSTTTVIQINPYQVSWVWPNSNHTSYLTAGTVSGQDLINQDYSLLGGANVHLASLSWINNDNLKDEIVNLGWNVTFNFSDPIINPTLASNSLNLTFLNGNKSDTLTLADLSSLTWSFDVGNVTWNVTDLHYMIDSPSDYNALNGLNWTTSKGHENTLWLVADIIDPPTASEAPSSVPEPSTVILFGVGLVGVGFLRKRHNK